MKAFTLMALLLCACGLQAAEEKSTKKTPDTSAPPSAAVVEMARQFAEINPPAQVVPNFSGFSIYGQGKSATASRIGNNWIITSGSRRMQLTETAGGGYFSSSTTPPTRIAPNSGGFSISGKDKPATAIRSGKNWMIDADGRKVHLNATSQGGYNIN